MTTRHQTLEDGTEETSVIHPDGSVGVTLTNPKTGRFTHYDSAPMPRRGMPKVKPSYLGLAVAVAIAVLIAAGTIVAAYYRR